MDWIHRKEEAPARFPERRPREVWLREVQGVTVAMVEDSGLSQFRDPRRFVLWRRHYLGDSQLHWYGEFKTRKRAQVQDDILASGQVAFTNPL